MPGCQFQRARQEFERFRVVVRFVGNHTEVVPGVSLFRVESERLFQLLPRFGKVLFEEERPAERKVTLRIVWTQLGVAPEVG